jgi:hypothetical protein
MNLERVNRIRGRVKHSEGVYIHVEMGEQILPRLSGMCHGLRKLISGRLLGETCLWRRNHAIQHDLLR